MAALTARRQPADVRREQILDAAQAVMLRDGLHEATIAAIAEAAALGKGTVYLHFESKQEVVAGMRRRYIERIVAEVATQVTAAGTWAAKLSAFVDGLIAASTRDIELHHLLFQDAEADEVAAFAPLRALFADIVRQGSFETSNIELAIDYTLGGIHAGVIAMAHMPKNRRRVATSQIVELAARSLGA